MTPPVDPSFSDAKHLTRFLEGRHADLRPRLVQSQDGFIWHYSIALTDDHAVSWGPVRPACAETGRLALHRTDHRFSPTILVEHLPAQAILDRVVRSFRCFDLHWRYHLLGWNCEHWARLVATGDPVSHQTWMTPFWRNPDSIPALARA